MIEMVLTQGAAGGWRGREDRAMDGCTFIQWLDIHQLWLDMA